MAFGDALFLNLERLEMVGLVCLVTGLVLMISGLNAKICGQRTLPHCFASMGHVQFTYGLTFMIVSWGYLLV
jgi:hypothetical protein